MALLASGAPRYASLRISSDAHRPTAEHSSVTARFVESDKFRALEVPQDDRLRAPAKSIDSAMQAGTAASVCQACGEFLSVASCFTRFASRRSEYLRPARFGSARTVRPSSCFGDYRSRNDAHVSLAADCHPETSHLVRHVPQQALPRVLSSPRLPALRVSRVVAHTRLLRAYCYPLPPRTRHSGEAPCSGCGRVMSVGGSIGPEPIVERDFSTKCRHPDAAGSKSDTKPEWIFNTAFDIGRCGQRNTVAGDLRHCTE